MKKIIYTLLVLPFFMLGISCDDFLTEEPENSVTNGNFWKTEQDAESAIYGLHRLFRTTFGSINYVYRDRGFESLHLGSLFERDAGVDQLVGTTHVGRRIRGHRTMQSPH